MKQIPLAERRNLLLRLGEHLRTGTDEFLAALQHRTSHHNLWLTVENQQKAVSALANDMLGERTLQRWLDRYQLPETKAEVKTVGLVLAGNIPLVGFHDVVSVFLAGHRAQIKPSDKDPYVLPYLLQLLGKWDERATAYFSIVPRLENFDAVIATGSDNSARYFEQYFGKYPHVIRRNRNGVAVLSGRETDEQLRALAHDVFDYFGLGCRNVSKLYVPQDYDPNRLLEMLHEHRDLVRHGKYKNNFDYNFAVLTLNGTPFYNNGCVMLVETEQIPSRIAQLHFERYENLTAVIEHLKDKHEAIQVIVSAMELPGLETFPLGAAQHPKPWNYADGVDTIGVLERWFVNSR